MEMLSKVALGTKCRSLAMMPTTLLSSEAMFAHCLKRIIKEPKK